MSWIPIRLGRLMAKESLLAVCEVEDGRGACHRPCDAARHAANRH